ncbi:MAG: hypothetical protein JW763_03215 [candidate division Zixibacteria bacterium]|nr:hypothetical protein [candidate division Zixibacteria bacterium]
MRLLNLLILATCILLPGIVLAGVFIDWRGDFYVEYPDEWYQVEDDVVRVYLTSQGVQPDEFDYDGMLAQRSQKMINEVPYMFISFYPFGEFSKRQIDSALVEISREHGKEYITGSLRTDDIQFRYDRPVYDAKLKTVAVLDKVGTDELEKSVLEMRRFYEQGIVVFYCFVPRDMYLETLPVLLGIMRSFSTENIDEMVRPDSAKIVDVSERERQKPAETERPEPGRTGGIPSTAIIIIILAVAVLLVVWFVIVKAKK